MSKNFPSVELPTDYQTFIHKSRYARWLDDKKRRETHDESVRRYIENVVEPKISDIDVIRDLETAIMNLEVMPSMRALMTSGAAMNRDNTCAYNCAYLPIDDIKAFDEAMFILLCGTGVGFSVERQYVSKLPEIPDKLFVSQTEVIVKDSKEGWAKALRQIIALLYSGEIPKYNVDKVRPTGARLKTFGGRASGPGPLIDLFGFVINTFKNAAGRKLTSIECHDIVCKIADIVVVGGVRRSATISFSNLSDDKMRYAKSGEWWINNGQRRLANNSVCYSDKPDMETFIREWVALIESKSGERGIFNREASTKKVLSNGRRDGDHEFGANPCCEIILRPHQFCNLTEIVVKEYDTEDTLREKARLASILGTVQATYTKFPYLRKIWTKNTEEERLLGVSLTGIMDNAIVYNASNEFLEELKNIVIDTNKEWAEILGIPQSTATTTGKPSGTVSQYVNSSSGIHARFSNYYLRRVRGDNKDPLTQFLKETGIYNEPDVTAAENTTVFSFPVEAPKKSKKTSDFTAIQQLETWMKFQRHWCEHKPSVTINVQDHEWLEVGAWVYKNFDEISGISFLPLDSHTYLQAPYEKITKKEYLDFVKSQPEKIDWELLEEFETEDNTTGSQTLACTAGSCEVVDI